ncbi:hypothetical protein TSOC_014539 [Tetrabaena socialis]|uniref:Uncharacterized protein n=1 Tax=Tetrabaena socialis TaxID=47790 RepID=A0A2J7ZHF0_9CHLO|nr:hypothetical protein TSOC_014539 [Tetrabaena socialis]|eukprot:PNG99677.1 hypothetical protein TSOC_014539 [Tetrabaena socialis]
MWSSCSRAICPSIRSWTRAFSARRAICSVRCAAHCMTRPECCSATAATRAGIGRASTCVRSRKARGSARGAWGCSVRRWQSSRGLSRRRPDVGRELFPRAGTRRLDKEAAGLHLRRVQLGEGTERGRGAGRAREGVRQFRGVLAWPEYFTISAKIERCEYLTWCLKERARRITQGIDEWAAKNAARQRQITARRAAPAPVTPAAKSRRELQSGGVSGGCLLV